jgi:hypothetical protein
MKEWERSPGVEPGNEGGELQVDKRGRERNGKSPQGVELGNEG